MSPKQYLPREQPPSHVLYILQPLEIAHSNSSSIAEDIRQKTHSFFEKNLLSLASSRPIGSLDNQLAVESISVVDINRLLKGSRDKDVTELPQSYHL